jgi:hypothetical protein
MIIFDNSRYCFRVVDEDYQLTDKQQIVERENIRQHLLEQLDDCGFASIIEPHQCCKGDH